MDPPGTCKALRHTPVCVCVCLSARACEDKVNSAAGGGEEERAGEEAEGVRVGSRCRPEEGLLCAVCVCNECVA